MSETPIADALRTGGPETNTPTADETCRPVALTLFVSGASPRSAEAVATVRGLCERRLSGRYSLEVIDIYQQPDLIADEQLASAPTLVRRSPGPVQRLVGDVFDTRKLLTLLLLDEDGPHPDEQGSASPRSGARRRTGAPARDGPQDGTPGLKEAGV